ncbi:ATP-binding protein [Streptacidiphilus jiangxiensis]|uniref:ATP-binding protein n=1 Tax=Streptacidiphilus jiangxiensis TaxID=235985 RepID=UPI000A593146|nr:ATP-binding protein [Streptacidiphilus jiangxiensis]
MTEWGWADPAGADAEETIEDVLLVVSELVSNAMIHGGGAVELVLDVDPVRLTVGVSDLSPVRPVAREPEVPARPGGHGLLVVRRLCARWGTTPLADGKFVWAEFDAV